MPKVNRTLLLVGMLAAFPSLGEAAETKKAPKPAKTSQALSSTKSKSVSAPPKAALPDSKSVAPKPTTQSTSTSMKTSTSPILPPATKSKKVSSPPRSTLPPIQSTVPTPTIPPPSTAIKTSTPSVLPPPTKPPPQQTRESSTPRAKPKPPPATPMPSDPPPRPATTTLPAQATPNSKPSSTTPAALNPSASPRRLRTPQQFRTVSHPSSAEIAAKGGVPSCVEFARKTAVASGNASLPPLGANGTPGAFQRDINSGKVTDWKVLEFGKDINRASPGMTVRPGDYIVWKPEYNKGDSHIAVVQNVSGSKIEVAQRNMGKPYQDTATYDISSYGEIRGIVRMVVPE